MAEGWCTDPCSTAFVPCFRRSLAGWHYIFEKFMTSRIPSHCSRSSFCVVGWCKHKTERNSIVPCMENEILHFFLLNAFLSVVSVLLRIFPDFHEIFPLCVVSCSCHSRLHSVSHVRHGKSIVLLSSKSLNSVFTDIPKHKSFTQYDYWVKKLQIVMECGLISCFYSLISWVIIRLFTKL